MIREYVYVYIYPRDAEARRCASRSLLAPRFSCNKAGLSQNPREPIFFILLRMPDQYVPRSIMACIFHFCCQFATLCWSNGSTDRFLNFYFFTPLTMLHAAFAPERPWQKKRALEMDLLVSQSSGGTADGRRLTALAVRVFFVRRAKFERGI